MEVRLHPGSSREQIKLVGGGYEVWIKEKPIDGKANVALVKMFKKHLKMNIKIIKGLKSRNKIIEVL